MSLLRRSLLALLALGAMVACHPATSVEQAPATTTPAAVDCTARPLALRPHAGTPYRVTIEERGQTYTSTLTFQAVGPGWSAVESAFSLTGSSQVHAAELDGAQLAWTLDGSGTPTGPPRISGGARQELLPNLSMFAFRPAGITTPSTCLGAEGSSRWTDAGDRVRDFRFRVVRASGGRLGLQVEGVVTTPVNAWHAEGELDIDAEDGLTGEGVLRVRGPGAPQVNVFERRIVVARAGGP
jgi:hypothetical protein